ncbi:MAG: hypothetical protein U1U88_001377 [Lawsonella clevelandensis]
MLFGFATAVGAQTGLAVRDAACAGAGIPFYWHTMKSFQFPVAKAPQRLAIDKHTKLVVVSLGGNDTYTNSMIAVLAGCIASWSIPKYYNQGNPLCPQDGPRNDAAREGAGAGPHLHVQGCEKAGSEGCRGYRHGLLQPPAEEHRKLPH